MGIPDHRTCLLRNVHAGQEETVRTGHGTTDLFQIGKGVHQGCILSSCLLNLYAEYIMRNAGLEEAQAGIKIARRNINNLRYADDTTLMVESESESEVAQLCPTLLDPMDCSLPGSSVHGIFQARVLEWGATAFSTKKNSVQFSSVTQSCPGLPVHHQLPEFTQTHVHQVSDAIQPSHPLSSPSPPAPNPSQHQSLFQ